MSHSRRDGAAGQLLPGPLRTGHAWEPSVGRSHSELREDVQASQAPALSHCDSSLPQRSYYLTQVQVLGAGGDDKIEGKTNTFGPKQSVDKGRWLVRNGAWAGIMKTSEYLHPLTNNLK